TQNTDSITTVLFLVEHLMLFVAAPNAHTYRLLIFKDLLQLAEEAFCSSAKRQDYEVFQTFRQALLLFRFLRLTQHLFASFREGPNYSKGGRCLARLFDIFRFHRFQGSHLAHHCLACRCCGSACCCHQRHPHRARQL
ncbi:hypothetical protein, partial [Duganella sp. BK701]|uniref:hypothetical protein n=1 Tax=Duganella sp. BK701 TaxID=2512166 RepID=UPI001E5D0C44